MATGEAPQQAPAPETPDYEPRNPEDPMKVLERATSRFLRDRHIVIRKEWGYCGCQERDGYCHD